MNTLIVVDTSGLISLVSVTDSNHGRALAASERLLAERRTFLVPGEVFTEAVNTLGKKAGHAAAGALAKRLTAAEAFVIIETTPALRAHALRLFGAQPNGVSLTDCFVMVVAERYETKEIFGFDAVFAKNGYRLPGENEQAGREAA